MSMNSSSQHHSMMHGGQMMDMGNLKQKFWTSLILAVPILFLAPAMGKSLPFQFQFPGSEIVVVIFATALFFYGGAIFLKGAVAELKNHHPEMMTLISLGITTAYVYSIYAFIQRDVLHNTNIEMDFFWELATLILIMLLGHWLEMKSLMSAQNSLTDLASLLPDKVHLQKGEKIQEVDLNKVKIGDRFVVRAGEAVPLDGTIISGSSTLNESLVTGESRTVAKTVADAVIGGAINGDQTLVVQATQSVKSGFLANILHLVHNAQSQKSRLETLADRVSGWLFYAAVVIGIITFIVWTSLIDLTTGLQRLVTVLVIACPHALGLAIPLVNTRSMSLSSQNGLLIRNRKVIDISPKIDYVLLDKTGTLTAGNFQVQQCRSLVKDLSDQDVRQIIGSLEQDSNHPIAQSVQQYLQDQKITPLPAKQVTTITGQGIKGIVKDEEYQLLNRQAVAAKDIKLPDPLTMPLTTSYLVKNQQVCGYLSVGDQLKPTAQQLITQLKQQNITPIMLTGDNQAVAAEVASQLGIDDFKAQLLPQDKQTEILKLQAQGHKVMMVGDGINDAPSLAQADIGVAIGAGTDIAMDAADVILVDSEPLDIIKFLHLAKNTHRKTIQNLWWGAGYNIVALPLASGLFAFAGIILNPAVGAILMTLSTIIVAVNASLLKI
ncbi:cadmium-translocating P-type ATPase [Lactobacillus bombi]|nr:cadmium-translocating P-type ATPase [Bombilactobacillus bombi]